MLLKTPRGGMHLINRKQFIRINYRFMIHIKEVKSDVSTLWGMNACPAKISKRHFPTLDFVLENYLYKNIRM